MTKITGWQVVHAEERGDQCYEGKKGWYYHALGEHTEIITSSVCGPFATVTEATGACDVAQREPKA